MEDQILTNVPSVETCVCFASPADLLGEVVGVACVTKAGSANPTIEQIRDGLPQVMSRFKPRVLVIMDATAARESTYTSWFPGLLVASAPDGCKERRKMLGSRGVIIPIVAVDA